MTTKIPDAFHAFLVESANYAGKYEIPVVQPTNSIPNKVIPFSKALSSSDYDAWVVFYEHDAKFARIWNRPKVYLPILKRFQGVISPDFSLYRNMPLCMQIANTYKGKALAHYWQENGIDVIPNIRFGDARTFEFCFDGVPKHSVVSIGTHGCIHRREDKLFFQMGLERLVEQLAPHTIVVYGATPDELFLKYIDMGIHIVPFPSATANYFASKKPANKKSSPK